MSQELIKRIEDPKSVEKFSKIFGAVNKVDDSQAKQMFEVEKFHFLKEISEKNLSDCSEVSIMGAFLDVVSNGLSFASGAKHVYLMKRSVKSGRKTADGKDIYEDRLVYSTTPDGKIYQAHRAGSVDYVTDPVIVYEGDTFEAGDIEGKKYIKYIKKIPRTSSKIIAGFVYKVMPNGTREPFWMDIDDIERLKGYSAKQNSKWDNNLKRRVAGDPNALYNGANGQIDTGFFGAKLINFALKNVRKSGTASQFEVNGDAGDAAIITGATELPEPDQGAQFEPAYVVEATQNLRDTIAPQQASHTATFSTPAQATSTQRSPEPF
jgi:recombinational DNA repair protein RecT